LQAWSLGVQLFVDQQVAPRLGSSGRLLVGEDRIMIDVTTRKPLRVSNLETSTSRIDLAFSQLAEVRRLLDEHGIRYSVGKFIISLNDGPEKTVIRLAPGTNAAEVQAILDNVPFPPGFDANAADEAQAAKQVAEPRDALAEKECTVRKPLRVSTEGGAGPFIRLPASRVEEIQRILKIHGVRHWVKENYISLNGGPFAAVIELGYGGNASAVQAILDRVNGEQGVS